MLALFFETYRGFVGPDCARAAQQELANRALQSARELRRDGFAPERRQRALVDDAMTCTST